MSSLPLPTRIRNRRRELGYLQAQAAEMAGISQTAASFIERGIPGYASATLIRKYCEVLGVELEPGDLADEGAIAPDSREARRAHIAFCPSDRCPHALIFDNGHEMYMVPYFRRIDRDSTDDVECPACRTSLVCECPSCGAAINCAQPTCEVCHAFIVVVSDEGVDWGETRRERAAYRRQINV